MSTAEQKERPPESDDGADADSSEPEVSDTNDQPTEPQDSNTQSGPDQETDREPERSNGDKDRDEYLINLDYGDNDNERKRVEYLLNNSPDITVATLDGLVRKVEVEDFDAFHEDLLSKLDDKDDLATYELETVSSEPGENFDEFSTTTTVQRQKIDWAFDLIVKKRDAAPEGNPDDDQYVVNTKKGTARFTFDIEPLGDGEYSVMVKTWGYGDAPTVLKDFIQNELKDAI